MSQRIFLSHKGANKGLVSTYYSALSAAGFHPWFDIHDMPAGTNPDRGMKNGFRNSCAVVFFLTQEFKDERFLADEINYAKEEERNKGDRFAIISLVLNDSSNPNQVIIPDLLKQYIWIEETNHLLALAKVINALPIRLGNSRWVMDIDPDEIDASLRFVEGKIESPKDGGTVDPQWCIVSGKVAKYSQQPLYLFTGDNGRYWPSSRIVPNPEGEWTGRVNLGKNSNSGTIRLAAVDPNMVQYIEVYRSQAGHLEHSGMVIPRFPWVLAKITVKIDLSKA